MASYWLMQITLSSLICHTDNFGHNTESYYHTTSQDSVTKCYNLATVSLSSYSNGLISSRVCIYFWGTCPWHGRNYTNLVVSCDSRYMTISICHEMSCRKVFIKSQTKKVAPAYLWTQLFLTLFCSFYDHGNFFRLGCCSEPNPKCKILQLYIFQFSTLEH